MSKLRIGSYECGSPKYKYFRRRKHQWRGKTFRFYMWLASCIKVDASFDKKYGK